MMPHTQLEALCWLLGGLAVMTLGAAIFIVVGVICNDDDDDQDDDDDNLEMGCW